MDLPQHIQNDEATAAKFHRCPSCAAFWDWDDRDTSGKVVSSGKGKAKGKKCGYTRCDACKYRFCGNCLVPWVGEGSAYLLGKTAHAKSCRYYRKLAESKYALHNRLEPDEETKAKLSEKKEKAKAKNAGGETEKKRKGSADDVGTIEETPRSGVAKKQKRVATWWDEVAVRA